MPVGRLKDAGLIAACGYMLNTTEFRDAACDVMRQVAGEDRVGPALAAHSLQPFCSLFAAVDVVLGG